MPSFRVTPQASLWVPSDNLQGRGVPQRHCHCEFLEDELTWVFLEHGIGPGSQQVIRKHSARQQGRKSLP